MSRPEQLEASALGRALCAAVELRQAWGEFTPLGVERAAVRLEAELCQRERVARAVVELAGAGRR